MHLCPCELQFKRCGICRLSAYQLHGGNCYLYLRPALRTHSPASCIYLCRPGSPLVPIFWWACACVCVWELIMQAYHGKHQPLPCLATPTAYAVLIWEPTRSLVRSLDCLHCVALILQHMPRPHLRINAHYVLLLLLLLFA